MRLLMCNISVLIALFMCSCGTIERCPQGDICNINFYNNSNTFVCVGSSYALPDTSLRNVPVFTSVIKPYKTYPLANEGWKNIIEQNCTSGKMMFVVLNNDTIDKYGSNDVISNNRIEKRYELSIDSLEKLHWTIVYP